MTVADVDPVALATTVISCDPLPVEAIWLASVVGQVIGVVVVVAAERVVVAGGEGDRVTVVRVARGGTALVDVVSETAVEVVVLQLVVVVVVVVVVGPVAEGPRAGPAQATTTHPASTVTTANG